MTLLYTDEQEELRSTVRRFLAAHLPESTVPRVDGIRHGL